MKNLSRYTVLIVLLCVLTSFYSASAQVAEKEQDTEVENTVDKLPFFALKRFAFKTNAIDWFAVVPNFGVEYQVTDDPYKYMTVGLSAKWNWSSYHGTNNKTSYQPPFVYDIFDIRPEFRYYYRTTKKPSIPIDETRTKIKDLEARLKKFHSEMEKASDPKRKEFYMTQIRKTEKQLTEADSLLKTQYRPFAEWFMQDIWTTDRKSPRPWRAHYVGGYVNYANYAFKFGERGIRARNAFGFGATAGFVLPLHEYKKGAIDIDLGFSVGLLMARHDAFTHSIDGNYYTRLAVGDKYFSLKSSSNGYKAYPLVSELRVAFVWRHKSMKHEVKIDEEGRRREEAQKKHIANFLVDLDMNLPEDMSFENLRQKDTLSWTKFEAEVTSMRDTMIRRAYQDYHLSEDNADDMSKVINKRYNQITRDFSAQYVKEKREAEAKKRKPEKPETEKKKDAVANKKKGKDAERSSEKPETEKPKKEKTK